MGNNLFALTAAIIFFFTVKAFTNKKAKNEYFMFPRQFFIQTLSTEQCPYVTDGREHNATLLS